MICVRTFSKKKASGIVIVAGICFLVTFFINTGYSHMEAVSKPYSFDFQVKNSGGQDPDNTEDAISGTILQTHVLRKCKTLHNEC